MKITSIRKETTYFVETDEPRYFEYRTDGKGNWEYKIVESCWEPYYKEDVQREFERILTQRPGNE